MTSYLPHVADLVLNQPLAIAPQKAAMIAALLGARIGLDSGEIGALARTMPGPPMTQRFSTGEQTPAGYTKIGGGIAVVSVIGTTVTRGGYLEAMSGLVSYDSLKQQVAAASNDDKITSIILDLHTPGGHATGCFECADYIHRASKKKPMIAVVNYLACSAGYAIAAAANKIVTPPSGVCGNIGTLWLHVDRSRQMDAAGLTPTFIFAGAHKIDGNDLQPLTDEVKDDIQKDLDALNDMFIQSIARHRPKLSEAAIRSMEALAYKGEEAVALGLADELGTLEDVISELAKLDPVVRKSKYQLTRATYGEASAIAERLDDAHVAGVRAGMAAALAGRS